MMTAARTDKEEALPLKQVLCGLSIKYANIFYKFQTTKLGLLLGNPFEF